MDDATPPLISLLILLGISAYLAFTETALASVSRNRVKIACERGDSRAKNALFAIDNFNTAITTILICNNIAHISVATIVTVWVTRRWGLSYVSLSTILTTLVVFFVCEMLPKSLAKKYSFSVMLFSAGLLRILMAIFKPFSSLLTKIGDKAAEHSKTDNTATVTEDELVDIIEDMTEEGTLDEQQSELISSAIQFGDLTVQNILTPRTELTAIDIENSPQEVLEFLKGQTHSRIPVYRKSIDNIIGIIQTRKYMKKYMETGKAPRLEGLLDKVNYVHQNTEIHALLPLMSKQKVNVVIVTDQFGGTLGLVTIEDILEELVGEIYDETDTVEEKTQEPHIVYLDEDIAAKEEDR